MLISDLRANRGKGFTLIELLIVIAIILILISIALPNFLEAQIRAKVTRAKAEMRSLGQATAAYFNDYKIDPNVDNAIVSEPNRSRIWWGYASHRLTTPTAYIKLIPIDTFPDALKTLAWGWDQIDTRKNGDANRPYLVIVRVRTKTPNAELWHFNPPGGYNTIPGAPFMDPQSKAALAMAPGVYLSAGPDLEATLAYLGVGGKTYTTYNPTNGTVSKGDMWVGGY
ncbi:MAG: prepilin-type N-terminal cleavage/methylation domain-containing protein [Candidatus Omnitrophica bacterium]|nr:prepilin-type N-terminal cleavage/methylation domain-containing protein [Candidatus Omnitrophota bacterium]